MELGTEPQGLHPASSAPPQRPTDQMLGVFRGGLQSQTYHQKLLCDLGKLCGRCPCTSSWGSPLGVRGLVPMLWQEDQELLLTGRCLGALSSGLDAPVAETQNLAHHSLCQKVETALGATPPGPREPAAEFSGPL